MRSVVLSSRIRHLMKMSSLGVLGVVVAGCSSGFQRFDRSIYTEAVPQQSTQNPYPGDVDYTTTASTPKRQPTGEPKLIWDKFDTNGNPIK